MARNTAKQGREFENATVHFLEGCECETQRATPFHVGWRGHGYIAVRSAGSKGAVDLVFVPPAGLPLLFVQCKLSNPQISPAERLALLNLSLRAGALPLVAWWQVDPTTRRKRPHFRLLTGPGPKDWEPWTPGKDT